MSEDNIQSAIDAGKLVAGVDARIKIIEIGEDHDPIPVALVETDEGAHVAVMTDVVAQLDHRAAGPLRREGIVRLTEVDSFIAYVKRFATPDAIVYADTASLGFTAVLDEHPAGDDETDAAWRNHRAQYTCPRSPEWIAWTSLDGQPQPQEKFADFIESRLEDLTAGGAEEGYPSPTDVLTMARNLLVKTKGTFERSINPTDGTGVLVCKTENETGSTKIPRAFLVGVPVFEGGQRYRVEARVRFEIRDGRPAFTYVLHRRKEIERDAFGELRVRVGTETGFPVLAGIA